MSSPSSISHTNSSIRLLFASFLLFFLSAALFSRYAFFSPSIARVFLFPFLLLLSLFTGIVDRGSSRKWKIGEGERGRVVRMPKDLSICQRWANLVVAYLRSGGVDPALSVACGSWWRVLTRICASSARGACFLCARARKLVPGSADSST